MLLKFKSSLFFFLIQCAFVLLCLMYPSNSYAYACPNDLQFSLSETTVEPGDPLTFRFGLGLGPYDYLRVNVGANEYSVYCTEDPNYCTTNPNNVFTINTSSLTNQSYEVEVFYIDGVGETTQCTIPLSVVSNNTFCAPSGLESVSPPQGETSTRFNFSGCLGAEGNSNSARLVVTDSDGRTVSQTTISNSGDGNIEGEGYFTESVTNLPEPGIYTAQLFIGQSAVGPTVTFNAEAADSAQVGSACTEQFDCSRGQITCEGTYQLVDGSITCTYNEDTDCTACTAPSRETYQPYQLCNQIPDTTKKEACTSCIGINGIWTALGCIPRNPASAVGSLVTIGLNIAGGVALIMILAAGFMFTTSQGEPKRVGDAKDMMQSAVIGLLFIIFSITILQFIGSDLLKIPGFGSN
jgi:hypothetical protein